MISRSLICFSILSALCDAPPATPATVTGKVELRDSRDAGVKNRRDYSGVVVALKPESGSLLVIPGKATITQKEKTFTPHVLAITVGTVVDFPNFDPIFHNAFSSYSGQVFDIGLYPPGSSRAVRFTREGVVRVFCNIHASMSAMIVVAATPFVAVSRHDGSFDIPGVPVGEYEMTVFHERASEAGLQSLRRSVTAGVGDIALPTISISEAGYLSIPHKNKYGHDYADGAGEPSYSLPLR